MMVGQRLEFEGFTLVRTADMRWRLTIAPGQRAGNLDALRVVSYFDIVLFLEERRPGAREFIIDTSLVGGAYYADDPAVA